MSEPTRHISGRLKQTNKRHNKLGHASKRGVDRRLAAGGRVEKPPKPGRRRHKPGAEHQRSKFPSKDSEGAGRANRLNRARQIAAERRKQMVLKRRFGAGQGEGAPKTLCVVGLSGNADDLAFRVRQLVLAVGERAVNSEGAPGFVTTMASQRFKQRFSVLTPPCSDTVAVLDAVKVCDALVVVVEASTDGASFVNNTGVDTLCCARAQGLPNVVVVMSGLSAIPAKQRSAAKKLCQRFVGTELGEASKIVEVDDLFKGAGQAAQAAQLVRVLSETPSKDLSFRRGRSYMLAQSSRLVPATQDDGSPLPSSSASSSSATATDLEISGYVRGVPLSVNSLVHLTGIGTFRMRRVVHAVDPCPRRLTKGKGGAGSSSSSSSSSSSAATASATGALAVADPARQDSLEQTAEPDQLMGEQSFISEAELRAADARVAADAATKAALVGVAGAAAGGTEEMSIHQAWIAAAKEGAAMAGGANMFGDYDDDDDEDDPVLGALDGRGVPIGQAARDLVHGRGAGGGAMAMMPGGGNGGGGAADGMDLDEDEDDKHKSAAQVRAEAQAMRQQRRMEMQEAQDEDVRFPDEVDTPLDVPARIRFAKYRGLKSFRSSPWDPKESLPEDYAHIFQLANFQLSSKNALRRADALQRLLEKRQMARLDSSKRKMQEKKMQKRQQQQKQKKTTKSNGSQHMAVDEDEDEDMTMDSAEGGDGGVSGGRHGVTDADLNACALPGRFVTLVLADVTAEQMQAHPAHAPLVLSSLFAHENRVSVMHFLVQKSTTTCEDPVKSKDQLDVMCGFRRSIGVRPVFSQHNINSDKHKFERFLQPGRFTCASAYFPISFGSTPTLIMKTMPNGTKQLVASGCVSGACLSFVTFRRGRLYSHRLSDPCFFHIPHFPLTLSASQHRDERRPRPDHPQEDRAHGVPAQVQEAGRHCQVHVLQPGGHHVVQACRAAHETRHVGPHPAVGGAAREHEGHLQRGPPRPRHGLHEPVQAGLPKASRGEPWQAAAVFRGCCWRRPDPGGKRGGQRGRRLLAASMIYDTVRSAVE